MSVLERTARAALTWLVVALSSSTCLAADFSINVDFQRPAIFESATGALRARTPKSASRIAWVPASFQLVEVRQSNMFGPQLCGVAYTNSMGRFPTGTKFSCGSNLPSDVQLTIRGESARGFRVGSNSPWAWEQFDVAYAFNWYTPWLKVQSATLDYGIRRIGDPTNFSDISFRAAALTEILDLIYQQLNLQWALSPAAIPGATYVWSNWIVNDATSGLFGLSAPWTYNKTVHMPAGSDTSYVLDSTAHELGHVIYNLNHSGWDHYSAEVFDYMKSHLACTDYGAHFGAYEGFAHAVYSLAWAHHAQSVGDLSTYSTPEPTCSNPGISVEGNADEFYSYAIAGIPMDRPRGSLSAWSTRQLGANTYSFPPTSALWSFVANAGMAAEDVAGMWNQAMNGACSGSELGAPKFCGSRRFKCLVKNTILANGEPFPIAFTNVDCNPGQSSIQSVSYVSDGKYSVTFSPADYVDQYRLEVFDNGAVNPVVTAAYTSTTVPSVRLTTCKASKLRVRSSIDNAAGKASVIGPEFAITPTNGRPGCPVPKALPSGIVSPLAPRLEPRF